MRALVCLAVLLGGTAAQAGGWSESGARDWAFGLDAGQPAVVRVPVAFPLPTGAFALGLGGDFRRGDAFGTGSQLQGWGARLSAAFGLARNLTLFGSGAAGQTSLLAPNGHAVAIPFEGRVEVGALAGVRFLNDRFAVGLSARGEAPTYGLKYPRAGADLLLGFLGPVQVHAMAGYHMADAQAPASPLTAAATGSWGYDRMEFGAALGVPFSHALAFLEYHGAFALCGPRCPAARASFVDPGAMPQTVSPGVKIAFGPLVFGAGAELSVGHLFGKTVRAEIGAPQPAPWTVLASLTIAPGSMQEAARRSLKGSPAAVKVTSKVEEPPAPHLERARPVPQQQTASAAPTNLATLTPSAPAAAQATNPAYVLTRPLPDAFARLLVTVVDGATGRALAGAKVTGGELEWTSDEEGRLVVEVPAGVLELTARHKGYEDVSRALTLGRGKARAIALYLWPDGKRPGASAGVAGVVLDSRGEPVRAVISAQPFDGSPALHQEVDGIYELPLPPGKYRIEARAERMAPAQVDLELFSGETRAVDITLADGQSPPVKVEYGEVAFGEQASFVPGSDELLAAANPVLDALAAEILASHKQASLIVFAYVEPGDDEAHDQKLSAARARKVAAQLVARGLDPARIEAYGGGHTPIIAVGDDRYRNNRIEVLLQEKAP